MNKKLYILCVVFSPLILACGPSEDSASAASEQWIPEEKPAVAVEAAPVLSEPFVRGVEASGIVEGIREADVIAETSGIIRQLHFEIGSYLKKGDLLLTVENDTARSNLDFARQDLRTAELEFDAAEKSYRTGGTSLVAYNQSLTRLEAAKLQFSLAREAFENTEIRAPFAGYAARRDAAVSVGSYLNAGLALTHLVDASSFRVRLAVGEGDIARLREGAPARVFLNAMPDQPIEARVAAVSPGSSRSAGSFPVVVEWENRSGGAVRSGMSARVLLSTEQGAGKSLVVPSAAVFLRQGRSYVFRVDRDRAELVEVFPEQSLGNRTALTSGPEEGDLVIVSGLGSLSPGDPVSASRTEP